MKAAMFFTVVLVSVQTSYASAQEANCGMARNPQQRANCYQQQRDIWREQERYQRDIENDYRRTHENTGRVLRYAPLIGPQAQKAWNYPRYGYDAYNWYNGN